MPVWTCEHCGAKVIPCDLRHPNKRVLVDAEPILGVKLDEQWFTVGGKIPIATGGREHIHRVHECRRGVDK